MKNKGYSHNPSIAEIRNYMKLTLEEKLAWLESALNFTGKLLKGKTKEIWEAFRSGNI
jgi:hypothetical protein